MATTTTTAIIDIDSAIKSGDLLITTKKEYETIIRPHTPDEYTRLTDSIEEYGQQNPIIISMDNERSTKDCQYAIILDGHHRYKICKELGITPKFELKVFPDKLQEELFVRTINLNNGRDLTSFERIQAALDAKPVLEAIARQRQIELGRTHGTDPLGKHVSKGRTNAEVGILAGGASYKTVEKVDYIIKQSDPVQLRKAQLGQQTIHKAYNTIHKEQDRKKIIKEADSFSIRDAPSSNSQTSSTKNISPRSIYGKFQDADIASDSVNLIFTDPPYEEKWLPNYTDLASFAANTLVPGGSLVSYCNHTQIPEIIEYMRDAGLTFWWIFAIFLQGPFKTYWSREVNQQYKLLLWFVKGKRGKQGHNIFDRIDSKRPEKSSFEWEQSSTEAEYVISQLTLPVQIVLDPMMGEGTTGIAALHLKRKFIGIEMDETRFKTAVWKFSKLHKSAENGRQPQ